MIYGIKKKKHLTIVMMINQLNKQVGCLATIDAKSTFISAFLQIFK